MTTKYIHRRAFVVPAANRAAANAILERQGYGPDNFTIPLVRTDQKDIMREGDDPVFAYVANFAGMTEVMLGIFKRKLAALGVREYDKPFADALTDEHATRKMLRHEFGVAIVVRAANRPAIITALTSRYPDAETRFLTTKLSVSGSAPVQAYAGRWQVDRSFGSVLKTFCDTFPKSEVWLWCKNRDALAAAKNVFDKPEYQNPDSVNRARARVRIVDSLVTQASILTELGLKVIP